MEGTRHEKVALIITAYVIGFTTAFIAFGLAKMGQTETTTLFLNAPKTAQAQEVHLTSVALSSDGLYSVTSEEERMISADRNALDASVIKSTPMPGFYEEIVDAEASRDGRFVYYCEQLVSDAENCDPYVYVLADDAVYHVQKDGAVLYPIIASHESMWTDESTLIVNGAVSHDQNRPWELFSAETADEQEFVEDPEEQAQVQ